MTDLGRVGAVGIDVGGSSARGLGEGAPLELISRRPVSRSTTLDEFLGIIRGVLGEVRASPDATVVIALPTFVDASGVLVECPSIPALTGVRLASLIATELSRPAPVLVPDLAAAVVGESRLGSGRDVDRFLCVALGTGANAAATRSGHVVDTVFGSLGDAGHVLVEPEGPDCACRGRGCLESVASGWALAREAKRIGLSTGADVSEAALSGDERAIAILDRAGTALGRAISTWSALLWPEVVAVAGGVARAGELLLAPARRELARIGAPYIVDRIQIVPAGLGDNASLLGSLTLAEDLR